MPELELSDFLNSIGEKNRDTVPEEGPHTRHYKYIGISDNFAVLTQGESIEDAYDGSSSSQSYYFLPSDVIPHILELKESGATSFELPCVYVEENGSWNHSYDRDDRGSATLCSGIVAGTLGIDSLSLTRYDLHFVPKGKEITLRNNSGEVPFHDICGVISCFIGNPNGLIDVQYLGSCANDNHTFGVKTVRIDSLVPSPDTIWSYNCGRKVNDACEACDHRYYLRVLGIRPSIKKLDSVSPWDNPDHLISEGRLCYSSAVPFRIEGSLHQIKF